MTNFYTENLADFDIREIHLLKNILTSWLEHGLPNDFYNSGTKPAFNKNSGNVFLVNDEYQVAMLNGNTLEIFHSLPYNGNEGFLVDLIEENNPVNLNTDDIEYIIYAADSSDIELSGKWLEYKNNQG